MNQQKHGLCADLFNTNWLIYLLVIVSVNSIYCNNIFIGFLSVWTINNVEYVVCRPTICVQAYQDV